MPNLAKVLPERFLQSDPNPDPRPAEAESNLRKKDPGGYPGVFFCAQLKAQVENFIGIHYNLTRLFTCENCIHEKLMKTKDIAAFTDNETPIADLKKLVAEFITERAWNSYHSPKNVAISIVLEASELLEHFQWDQPQIETITAEKKEEIENEMADVLAYLLSLSNVLGTDLSAALRKKMIANSVKYPVESFHGSWKKVKTDK